MHVTSRVPTSGFVLAETWLAHPEDHLFSLSKKSFLDQTIQEICGLLLKTVALVQTKIGWDKATLHDEV